MIFLLTCFAGAGLADTVNLTDGPTFNFRSGTDLFVRFSIWNYAVNNRDSSPYPTSVGLQLLGAEPSTSSLRSVTNSSGSYFAGYALEGWLENTEGTVAAPFTSPDAVRLSLQPGALLVEPGAINSGTTPIAVIEADAGLTLGLSEQIFGADVANRGSSAVIHLRNSGPDLQIGLEGGFSLVSAISEPSIRGIGSVQTSGFTQSISATSVPEPASFVLLLIAGFALSACALTRRRLTRTEAS